MRSAMHDVLMGQSMAVSMPRRLPNWTSGEIQDIWPRIAAHLEDHDRNALALVPTLRTSARFDAPTPRQRVLRTIRRLQGSGYVIRLLTPDQWRDIILTARRNGLFDIMLWTSTSLHGAGYEDGVSLHHALQVVSRFPADFVSMTLTPPRETVFHLGPYAYTHVTP